MEFSRLIDKEDIILDSHKLAKFYSDNELKEKIDNLVEKFISDNISTGDYKTITLIYRLVEEIQKHITGGIK